MKKTLNISLIDHSPARRAEISYLLSRQGLHVEPFEDVAEFLKMRPCNCVVLVHDDDESLPQLVARPDRDVCLCTYVAYSEEPDWQRVVSAVNVGAKTYVALPGQVQNIPAVIANVSKDILASERDLSRKAMARARIAMLSRRELDVLECVIAGDPTRLIGQKLGISIRTAEVHRSNLLKKMDARNAADLCRLAFDAGFHGVQQDDPSTATH